MELITVYTMTPKCMQWHKQVVLAQHAHSMLSDNSSTSAQWGTVSTTRDAVLPFSAQNNTHSCSGAEARMAEQCLKPPTKCCQQCKHL
jgi:hypothetical protein